MLLGLDPRIACCRFTETEKTTNLESKLLELLVLAVNENRDLTWLQYIYIVARYIWLGCSPSLSRNSWIPSAIVRELRFGVQAYYDFDIALSYAGEDRDRAKELAFALKRRGTRVFYDKDEAARLWGENLFTHLTDVYQNRARYCVALLSKHYAEKPWTRRELAAAQARAFGQKEPYLLPVRLDDTNIPGVLPTEAFVPWSGDSSDTIAELVLERLKGHPAPPAPIRRQLDRLDWRELQADYFEPFDAADAVHDEPATLETVYASIWLPHDDGVWNSTITDGAYRLANRAQHGAVRYLYLRIANRDMGESPVSVEVKLDAGESVSAAGLIYRFDRERRHYYAFVAAGRDQFRFYSRDSSGFRTLYAGTSHAAVNGKFNKLGIVAAGSLIQLYVNDMLVKKIEDESLREGDTGILGVGKGIFEFDNFTIYR